MAQSFTLEEIAGTLGARLVGDPTRLISGIQTLERAGNNEIAFLANPRYLKDLAGTSAAAVLLQEAQLDQCPVDALVLDNPYLSYAQLSHWFDDRPAVVSGIHPSAVVSPDAMVDASAVIGPGAVIEAGAQIGARVEIGPHSVVGAGSVIGESSRLAAGVTLYHQVCIGRRVLIHSAAVIGADGFGFANNKGPWQKIAQLGRVIIGDDVEIGAGTTIDRGALDDTRIGNGVKLDNQIQIAHNVQLGDDTAIAGCVGIAGSTKIGRRCTIAGGAMIVGHLDIADGVHISATTLVTKSLNKPGLYSAGTGMLPHRQWKKNVVRFRQLDQLASRLATLEKQIEKSSGDVSAESPPDKPKG